MYPVLPSPRLFPHFHPSPAQPSAALPTLPSPFLPLASSPFDIQGLSRGSMLLVHNFDERVVYGCYRVGVPWLCHAALRG